MSTINQCPPRCFASCTYAVNDVFRVSNLTDCVTYSVFMYTTRGLFECDKLIFTAQMAFQILLMKKEINPTELDFLLRFPAAPNTTSPVDFISNVGWGAIKTLSAMDEFRNLDRDIENNSKRSAERTKNKSSFGQMLVLQCVTKSFFCMCQVEKVC